MWRVGSVLKFCLGLSRVQRAYIWRHGGVSVNGEPVGAQHVHCRPGDDVRVWYPEPTSTVRPEPDAPLQVLYEDDWLLAVAKPPGRLSHPARGEQSGTVANAVAARYQIDGGAQPAPVRPVHRLDRDTSGLLLFARDTAIARALVRQRAAGQLRREYLALVTGEPPSPGEIDLALGPDPEHRTRRRVAAPGQDASGSLPPGFQEALTTYRVVQYGPRAALVVARLRTGRTHQLRAHFAAIGHPVLGDGLYGQSPGSAPGDLEGDPRQAPGPPPRQALHAWRARLRHPRGGAPLTLTAPLPRDFIATAREALRDL
ncbi:MAG TPA: RluA family pseudouridine synthase [Chloroflexota bacterium]|nr:RluA family pseudouridine synthase [Chloroflexota bacterium]